MYQSLTPEFSSVLHTACIRAEQKQEPISICPHSRSCTTWNKSGMMSAISTIWHLCSSLTFTKVPVFVPNYGKAIANIGCLVYYEISSETNLKFVCTAHSLPQCQLTCRSDVGVSHLAVYKPATITYGPLISISVLLLARISLIVSDAILILITWMSPMTRGLHMNIHTNKRQSLGTILVQYGNCFPLSLCMCIHVDIRTTGTMYFM